MLDAASNGSEGSAAIERALRAARRGDAGRVHGALVDAAGQALYRLMVDSVAATVEGGDGQGGAGRDHSAEQAARYATQTTGACVCSACLACHLWARVIAYVRASLDLSCVCYGAH